MEMGTAPLAASRPWIRALSLYGNDYRNNIPYRNVTIRRHTDGPNHLSVPISPPGGRRAGFGGDTGGESGVADGGGKPDILLFQAGADPFREDPYSPLNLDHDDLYRRDETVFAFARENGILNGARHVQIIGHYAYVSCDAGLVVVDINEPKEPKVTAVVGEKYLKHPKMVAAQFRYAYVCDEEGVKVLDITDLSKPVPKAMLRIPERTASIWPARTRTSPAALAAW